MPQHSLSPPARLAALIRTNHGTFRGWVRHALALTQWLAGGLNAYTVADLRRFDRLVFVCLGNINRSAFAEAVARREGAQTVSLGLATNTGAPAFAMAVETSGAFHVDLSSHRATALSDHVPRQGDLLLVMEVRHIARLRAAGIPASSIALLGAWSYPRRLHIHDPHTLSAEYFKTCFAVIESATRNLVADWQAQRALH